MKKRGTGGANTKTGLDFENKTDLRAFLCSQPGYNCVCNKRKWGSFLYNNKEVALDLKKNMLYNYLKSRNIIWNNRISKKLLPDECIYIIKANKIFIIEKKHQQTNGSVDEKLQTCHFKKKQYKKLLAPLTKNVEYIYLLDNWFNNSKYKDVLKYIKSVKCSYCFGDIDNIINILDLPGVTNKN